MNRAARGPDRRRRPVRGVHPLSLSAVGEEPAALDLRRPVSRGVRAGRRAAPTPAAKQTECLVAGRPPTTTVRGGRSLPAPDRPPGRANSTRRWRNGRRTRQPPFRPVETLRVGDQALSHLAGGGGARGRRSARLTLAELLGRSAIARRSSFPGGRRREPVREDGRRRSSASWCASSRPSREPSRSAPPRPADGLFRLTLRVVNRTPLDEPAAEPRRRPAAVAGLDARHPRRPRRRIRLAAGSAGAMARGGRRVPQRRHLAGAGRRGGAARTRCCRRRSSSTTTRRWRPKVPGDLFDGTEIDEMLTLRILTLTDEEKRRDGRGGRPRRRAAGANRGAGPRAAAAACTGRPRVAAGAEEGGP